MAAYRGPGMIRVGPDRKLQFTIYADSYKDDSTQRDGLAGELVPDDAIYRLSAVDSEGGEWIATSSFDVCVQPNADETKAVLTGRLAEVCSSRPIFPKGVSAKLPESSLILRVFGKVDVPLNTRTVTKKQVDGDEFPTGGAKLNVARFEAGSYRFSLTHDDDLLEIQVKGQTLVPGLDKRVIESLQFVLARPVWWTIQCEERDDTVFTRIRSAPPHLAEESHLPSIGSIYIYDRTECVWLLFAKYFEHILGHDEHSWHPLSRYVYSAFEAHAAGFDTYRLALGVAIEGILESEFKDAYAPTQQFLDAVNSVIDHIHGWKHPATLEDAENFRKRVEGSVSTLRNPRAGDRLKALIDKGVVTNGEFSAWKGLRNKAAHGDRPDRLPTQPDIDQVDTVTTLMHKLVFQAIGYAGKYTDYGTRGFPTRDFPSVR